MKNIEYIQIRPGAEEFIKELSEFYEGTLNINGQDVFVLKVQDIIQKVGKEIAAA